MVNFCSPPKNALLLMRCRSDPVKVADLANQVRERQMSLDDGACGGREEDEEEEERRREVVVPETPKEEELVEDSEEGLKIHEEEIEAMIIKHIENYLRNAVVG
ncbi:unnamed protein product [Eruca vesicaria subsp. sativa]|uniref:Uncharacterized protein n=1 Tax=Eruca vesicaria subsp. sativa TaxID=29727 RepID=A0ABC8K1E6_ERUVS|nr:unnamed protein product [Eruca vesicaria subsp. sativa]